MESIYYRTDRLYVVYCIIKRKTNKFHEFNCYFKYVISNEICLYCLWWCFFVFIYKEKNIIINITNVKYILFFIIIIYAVNGSTFLLTCFNNHKDKCLPAVNTKKLFNSILCFISFLKSANKYKLGVNLLTMHSCIQQK